jgi:DNA-directed RNA polymerase subunit RPC12/RpoP
MSFACPACGAPVAGSPESWMLRCPACGRRLRSRRIDDGRPVPAYEVEVVGEPETARRVEWLGEPSPSRLRRWLAWATVATLGLVALLYALARWWR